MKRMLATFVLLLGLFVLGLPTAMGQTAYRVEEVPNVVLADSLRLTSDPAGLISPVARQELDERLVLLRRKYGVEVTLVLLPSIGERDVEGFANDLFRAWGVGNKSDHSGLLILLVGDQRRLRFEVGYGLEPILTDALSQRIQSRSMLPHFRRGDYAAGLRAGIEDIDAVLAERWERTPERGGERDQIDSTALIICYLIFVGIALVWFMTEQRRTLSRATSPHIVRQILPQMAQSYQSALWVFALMCLPVALVIYLSRRYYMKRLEHLALQCGQCARLAMAPVPAAEGARYLTSGDRAEELVGSSSHRVYLCGSCQAVDVVKDTNPSSKAAICPRCGYRTLIAKAPYRVAPALVRLERHCVHCRHHDEEDHRIAQDTGADDLLSGIILSGLWGSTRSGGGGFGGGFGGGGFSGGSFGGGSSGGGGATSGW